jgi:hypothetical protein
VYPPAAGENCGVYFGDQVTDVGYRGSAGFLSDQSWLNRDIAGRTTDQGLVRFRQDVIDLYNKVVVILVGAKDIAGFDGPRLKKRFSTISCPCRESPPPTAFAWCLPRFAAASPRVQPAGNGFQKSVSSLRGIVPGAVP